MVVSGEIVNLGHPIEASGNGHIDGMSQVVGDDRGNQKVGRFARALAVQAAPGTVFYWLFFGLEDVMGILCDHQIRKLIGIEPFEVNTKRQGKISYGVSSYGYDLRVGSVFKIFTNVNSEIVDPKKFSEGSFVTVDTAQKGTDHVLIPPNSFALCETVEVVAMPRECLAICVGKSTYARCGIIVNVTPIEPEWKGKITLEISNTTPLPAKIYANEGIAQLIFLKGDEVCTTSYADKGGKYQDQAGLTLPRVD